MDIYVKRTKEGGFQLSMGYVTFQLSESALLKLKDVISVRLNQSSDVDNANHERKLTGYRNLANKLVASSDRVVQEFAITLTTEQLVTIARLADGKKMCDKIVRNLSKQNGKQFMADFEGIGGVTEHQAIVNMEQAIPIIRKVASKVQSQTL